MTDEDRAELERWREIAATTPGRTARTLLDACNAIEALQAEIDRTVKQASDHIGSVLARLAEAEADRDRARDAAVALEQENAAVRLLHSPFKIYEPCGHEHEETDKGVTNVIEMGPTCQDGYMYTVCRHCCTDAQGFQTEECVSAHDHSKSVCPTNAALDGGEDL